MELVALAGLLERRIIVYSYSEEKQGKVEEMVFDAKCATQKEPVRTLWGGPCRMCVIMVELVQVMYI